MTKETTETIVLKYLTDQNRPYSVNDIIQNLHNQHGKAAVQKALDALAHKGKVREKTYGKQKVYAINQDVFPPVSGTAPQELDAKMAELDGLCKQNQEQIKASQAELKGLTGSRTTEEARALSLQLSKEVDELKAKYETLRGAQGKEAMSKEERNKIRQDRLKAIKEWKSRKRICMDMINTVLENCEKPKKALFEEIGIVTDEDENVKMPVV